MTTPNPGPSAESPYGATPSPCFVVAILQMCFLSSKQAMAGNQRPRQPLRPIFFLRWKRVNSCIRTVSLYQSIHMLRQAIYGISLRSRMYTAALSVSWVAFRAFRLHLAGHGPRAGCSLSTFQFSCPFSSETWIIVE